MSQRQILNRHDVEIAECGWTIVSDPISRRTRTTPSRRSLLVGAATTGVIGVLPEAGHGATADSQDRNAADEAQIRQLIEKSAEAIRAKNIEGLKAIYAPDIVSFDVGPALQSVGAAAKMQNWATAFPMFESIGYEVRGLSITVGDGMAFTHSINRLSGTLKNGNGNTNGPWVRNTNVYRKIDGVWLLAHDHVSVPINILTGQGLMNLEP